MNFKFLQKNIFIYQRLRKKSTFGLSSKITKKDDNMILKFNFFNQVLERKCTEKDYGEPFLTSAKDTIEVPFNPSLSVDSVRITFPNTHGQIAELLIYGESCDQTDKMNCPKSFQVSGFSGLNGLYSLTCQTSRNKPVWYSSDTDYHLYWRYSDNVKRTDWVFGKRVNSGGNEQLLAFTTSTNSSSCANFVVKGSWLVWNWLENGWITDQYMMVAAK